MKVPKKLGKLKRLFLYFIQKKIDELSGLGKGYFFESNVMWIKNSDSNILQRFYKQAFMY